jgi:adenylyltransferase/sulfurtransferase
MEFEFLSGRGTRPAVLCGRNAVQITPSGRGRLDLAALSERLKAAGNVERSEFMLRFSAGEHLISVFPDGRAIIAGTQDIAAARALYSKYIGA